MAWQIGVVADNTFDFAQLLGWLPVWAWSTPVRVAEASELRKSWDNVWAPEPALTLITYPMRDDQERAVLELLPTLELHHPNMTAVRVFGLKHSTKLARELSGLGYMLAVRSDDEGTLFTRPLDSLGAITELALDASNWQSYDDVYDAFFRAVGAPAWHGRNLDALNDSISTGAINAIEIPYVIVVRNASKLKQGSGAFKQLYDFASLIARLRVRGCPVDIRVEP